MKWKNEDKILLLASLLVLMVFSIPTFQANSPLERKDSQFDVMASKFSFNISDYTNFHGPLIAAGGSKMFRIFVDDNNPARNWTKTAAENDWCTGSGTWSDPYVIENLYIKGNGTGGMIFVKYSSNAFIIRNCWFEYSGPNEYDAGVLLQSTTNGTIEKNIFTFTNTGVKIEHLSTNNTVHDNIMVSDHTTAGKGRGLDLSSTSNNNTISKNRILNYYEAIFATGLTNIIVDGNYAENNIFEADYNGRPIYLRWCNDSQIVRNTLAGAFAYGRFEVAQIDSADNVIEFNQIIVNATWDFAPPEMSSLQLSAPSLSQTTTKHLITLEESHRNYIAYNIMIIGASGGIPSYDLVLLLGVAGVVSTMVVFITYKRRVKH